MARRCAGCCRSSDCTTPRATDRNLLIRRTGLPRCDRVHMSGHLDDAGEVDLLLFHEPIGTYLAEREAAPL